MKSPVALLTAALVLATAIEPLASLPADADDSAPRRLVRRQVSTIYHPPKSSVTNMGLDPFEERLLIALLGGCIAVVFALIVLVVCCRTYRVDRKLKDDAGGAAGAGGGRGDGWGFQQPMLMSRSGQMMAGYPGQAGPGGRPAYYPTGYQPSVQMDPAYLDPASGLAIVGGGQRQQQMTVDNTIYG